MAFKKSYNKIFENITPTQIWSIWSNIKKRPIWDDDTEWASIEGKFEVGNTFTFKPKGGSKLKMKIVECTPNKSFTDYYNLPLAHLYGIHKLEQQGEKLCITTTIYIKGPLYWVWQKLIGEKIVATLPHQTELLVKAARQV